MLRGFPVVYKCTRRVRFYEKTVNFAAITSDGDLLTLGTRVKGAAPQARTLSKSHSILDVLSDHQFPF